MAVPVLLIIRVGEPHGLVSGHWGLPPENLDDFDPVEDIDQVVAVAGAEGPTGPSGSLSPYEHTQSSALSTWVVNHNLNRKLVAVRVMSPGGVEVIAGTSEVTPNQLQVDFASPQTGRVLVA